MSQQNSYSYIKFMLIKKQWRFNIFLNNKLWYIIILFCSIRILLLKGINNILKNICYKPKDLNSSPTI